MKLSERNMELIKRLRPMKEDEIETIRRRIKGISLQKGVENEEYMPICLSEINPEFPDEFKKIWPGHIEFTV